MFAQNEHSSLNPIPKCIYKYTGSIKLYIYSALEEVACTKWDKY